MNDDTTCCEICGAPLTFEDAILAGELMIGPCCDAAAVEEEYRNTPSDLTRCTIKICAITGDHVIADQLGRFIARGTRSEMDMRLAELQTL